MLRSILAAALIVLLSAISPAVAAPCTSDAWQPTFVHDLDENSGPYYVNPNMTFLPLQWRPDGGYVPHACALVRSRSDLRDPRGFTTCQDYTRVQCGCSRTIPGNSTCAAFLRARDAMRQSPAPGPGAGTGLFASPGPGPQAGGQSVVSVPATGWVRAQQYRGGLQAGPQGVVVGGAPWTNGQLRGGYYDGNKVVSAQAFDLSGGGDVYMKILAHGGGKYMAFWPRAFEGVGIPMMTTHHSWANSTVVPENTWIFSHLHVERGGAYTITVASGAYDDRGGRVFSRGTGRLANPRGRLELQFSDNYAGQAAYMVIGEAVVRTGGGATMPPPGQPARGGQPSGGSCSAPGDCQSGICLLGVCAPPSR